MTSDGLTRAHRSATQILFGHLPGQTIDMHGGVWKVDSWRNPRFIRVDSTALRERAGSPCPPLVNEGQRRRLRSTRRERRQHPSIERRSQERCRHHTIPRDLPVPGVQSHPKRRSKECQCGASSWGQLHFVGYHTCGEITEPLDPALHNSRSGQSRLSRVIRCPPDQICLPCLLGRTPARLRLQSLPVWPRQHVLQRSPSSGRFSPAQVLRLSMRCHPRRWQRSALPVVRNVRSPGCLRACQKAAWRMFWSISTPWSKTWLPEASRDGGEDGWPRSG